ncbi:MAG: AbrB/MazE/SpoVT family DNA-binding domain-containing protein [Eubacteriales bacterium]|nr:AbrB/MazE/SpoVT family DNA-binding domain-containing protein [Eubacteriales bacterium]
MKSTGIVRKIDELGRIVLPIEIRNTMDIKNRDGIEIFIDEDKIILKKYEPACVFCANAENVTYFKGKLVCYECIETLKHSVQ